ncbi:MAG TPA: hypothetical protein VMR34_03680 [Candidatus Saccharimonadales bacterium]|nr:hypothetical protein [Candidatus Saccharimonadales bacterium]
MINDKFIFLALAITVFGNLAYLKDTLKGETKPNRVTWLLWGAAPLISYFSQRTSGGGIQTLYTLAIGAMPFVILGASFLDKKAYWAITKFDLVCGGVSVIALILLVATGNGLLALVLSIIADMFASLPTIIKSYKHPQTETTVSYGIEIAASIIVILTIHHWIFVNYIFAIYILLSNIMFVAVLTRSRWIKQPSQ